VEDPTDAHERGKNFLNDAEMDKLLETASGAPRSARADSTTSGRLMHR
jgi:hypothetical protein